MFLAAPSFAAVMPQEKSHWYVAITVELNSIAHTRPAGTKPDPVHDMGGTAKVRMYFTNPGDDTVYPATGLESITLGNHREMLMIAELNKRRSGADVTDAEVTSAMLKNVMLHNVVTPLEQTVKITVSYDEDGGINQADVYEVRPMWRAVFKISHNSFKFKDDYTGLKPTYGVDANYLGRIIPPTGTFEVTAAVPELPAGALIPLLGLIGFGAWWIRRKKS